MLAHGTLGYFYALAMTMDTDGISHIGAALIGAIAEARAHGKEFGVDAEFRDAVSRARKLHDALIEALIANEPLATAYFWGLADSTHNALEELETWSEPTGDAPHL